ncbi:Transcriptional regulatory protein rtcR [Vibrio nigripulchritudo SO65]|uniref:RNA repair transcriptional activator RtcR n=1 Tax=Vibrio nigripulchritudo TaxID=28173 RepID=UPI0003B1CAA7|nr:RNA repair transcriptional activator RtcR [Vibrio nigripulchritudo]CCN36499.1 Transcriptional regulatory protein rtcR [Vibrio nigripulchritudo AM115]CCN43393.1 Transcriptional regulatory protein rtcR [Vibrio nigripulchritudo FTn2]CCN67639.1 Transcriptional regulatory protein rtcR [Vibrio nigripulchritudo POn4]CCN75249.1 Transcriptional regulatory protein rtcR [Vibrio nigripulchritudo SO65]
MKKTIAISLLGTQLDKVGKRSDRWAKWRPNISLVSQEDLVINELYLLHDNHHNRLANNIAVDIETISPETRVKLVPINFLDPWDFEEVYAKLYDFCSSLTFDIDNEDYLFHITTGTHVAQICGYLLTESRHFPGRLIQTAPDNKADNRALGKIQVIDLDLSKYDQLATRFDAEHELGNAFLKNGINTNNAHFNTLISQIEKVAIRSKEPILLTGPTGAGKTQLASKIYQLKKKRSALSGNLIVVNCATLKGENAMATLFGHTKGAFTGALQSRDGFLVSANKGLLFLDEIGELGSEEQSMLLHAIENKSFHPVGSDKEVKSDFQLIAGTNKDLRQAVLNGTFREDLLARINLWTYQLPALSERKEDIEPNIEFELDRFSEKNGRKVRFNKEAKQSYLKFAHLPSSTWNGNFRDLSSSITRLSTLADSSRITIDDVNTEIKRLESDWGTSNPTPTLVSKLLSSNQIQELDTFDRYQLSFVLETCIQHPSMASAGRELFDKSRTKKTQPNDSTRLQKYLAKFGITWKDINEFKQTS